MQQIGWSVHIVLLDYVKGNVTKVATIIQCTSTNLSNIDWLFRDNTTVYIVDSIKPIAIVIESVLYG